MLARKWTIVARFHETADYGIPEAPVFPAIEYEFGALLLTDPEDDAVAMVAGAPIRLRR
jgi:hypothetical protein